MDNTQIKQDIDNVNITIETPSDDSDIDLQALERDNWGRILNNKTFKVMKENFRLIKTSFNNFISNVTNEINLLVNKTNTIENNMNTIQSTVNELKVNGGKINESTLNLLANKETTNTFKELNTFEKGINTKSINLDNNILSVMEGETITIGDINKSINIIGKDTTLKYNGEEIKGGSNSNDGIISSDIAPFIGEYPVSSTIRSNDVGHHYFYGMSITEGSTTEFGTDIFESLWNFNIDIKKDTKPIIKFEGNVIDSNFTGNSIVATTDSNGNLTSTNIFFRSENFNKVLMEALGVNSPNEKIKMKNLCGIKFKFSLRVDHISDTLADTTGNNRYYATTELGDFEEKIYETFIYDRYNNAMLKDFTSNSNEIMFSSGKVKSISLSHSSTSGLIYFNIKFKDNTFTELYNAGNRMNIILKVKQIKLLKITQQSVGGSGGSGGSTDISSLYGVPVIAETINNSIYLPNIYIKKNEVLNARTVDHNGYLEVMNGNQPLETYYNKYSETGSYGVKDVPLTTFITYSGATYNNHYFIPNTSTVALNDLANYIFTDDIKMIPFNKIYGFKLKYSIKVQKIYDDHSLNKTLLDEVKEISVKFVKDNTANYGEFIEKRGGNEFLEKTGYMAGEYLKIAEIEGAGLFIKYNKSGAYYNSKVYNPITRTYKDENIYTFLYMFNADTLFSDNFKEIRISFDTKTSKILVKL